MNEEKLHLNITGMSCVNCANGIEKSLRLQKGILDVKVSFASCEGVFLIDTNICSIEKLKSLIENLGYKAEEDYKKLEEQQQKLFKELKYLVITSLSLTALMFLLAFTNIVDANIKKYFMFIIASIVQFYCGARFYTLSFKSIKNRNYDMNVLVALGTSAAYFYSTFVVFLPNLFPEHLRFVYFDGAAVIISFVLLGRYLEENSKQKASDFLKKLMDLSPLHANLIIGENIKEVLAKDLKKGDNVLVKTGEKIPSDGLIIKGEADIDTSMITGESMPVFKKTNDEVLAGTLNTNGVITIEVIKESNDTTLSKIINLLKTAQSKQIPISRFADKIANIFVPSVIVIAILTFLMWAALADMQNAILASISVLIISCPCALGLATPIAIVSAVSRGAKEGILIKNPEVLENIKDIEYAIFDKTGTLTKGEIVVSKTDIDEKYFELIGSIEKYSEHPISKAVVKYIEEKNIKLDKHIVDIQILSGKGIKSIYEGDEVLLGNKRLLEENGVILNQEHMDFYKQQLKESTGAILVAINSRLIGTFSLEDKLKEGAKELINSLKEVNIKPILLTGDNKISASKVAKDISIESVYSEVIPTQKYELIKKFQKNSKVMFVGDGINDAPTIKQADIGITLNSGADISKDAGDIILINNDLKSVMKSINLSSETMKIVKQNLFWAFIYNAIGIPLAAGILYPTFGLMLTPMYAGIAMSFSSVTVVLNSLRLKMGKL